MSRIQISDLNSSDFGFLSELTDDGMLYIDGGNSILALVARYIACLQNPIWGDMEGGCACCIK